MHSFNFLMSDETITDKIYYVVISSSDNQVTQKTDLVIPWMQYTGIGNGEISWFHPCYA